MRKVGQHRSWISRISLRSASVALALAVVLVIEVGATQPAHGQTFKEKVLYRFMGRFAYNDGANPYAGLVRDAAGNLYGTTVYAGSQFACAFPLGCGAVFKVDTTGTETVLHSFTQSDGLIPIAGLTRDGAGNLYGTTRYGGSSASGVVFKVDNTDKETVLYTFTGKTDGGQPFGGLIGDAAGNFYGTTSAGGASGRGVVFKLDKTGKETVLHSFTGSPDGKAPLGNLIRDAAGNFYGTTSAGGAYGHGVVFKLDGTDKETLLHSFTGKGGDGANPQSGLVRDGSGNLYGTTESGGASCNCGTVFKLDATGKETVLHRFTGSDGKNPYGNLVRDAASNLYGTSFFGGASGNGVVFKLDNTGKETVLYSFTGTGGDGAYPLGGLVRDGAGNLYGTTNGGGSLAGSCACGTVFELTPF